MFEPITTAGRIDEFESRFTTANGAHFMIEEPLMREIRYLDKLIDELARGTKMEKILREG